MKRNLEVRPGNQGNAAGNGGTSSKRALILRSLSMLVLFLAFVFVAIVLSRFSVEEEHILGVRRVARFEETREYSGSSMVAAT